MFVVLTSFRTIADLDVQGRISGGRRISCGTFSSDGVRCTTKFLSNEPTFQFYFSIFQLHRKRRDRSHPEISWAGFLLTRPRNINPYVLYTPMFPVIYSENGYTRVYFIRHFFRTV